MVWLVIIVLLFAGLIGLGVYGIVLTELSVAFKICLSLVLAVKEFIFWLVMGNDVRMKPRYFAFLAIDILMLSVAIYYTSIPLLIASAIALLMTISRINHFIGRNKKAKR